MIFEDYSEEIEGHTITRNKFEDWVDSHKSGFLKLQTQLRKIILLITNH